MRLSKKLDDLFCAGAFAEAGEFETARKLAAGDEPPKRRRRGRGIRVSRPRSAGLASKA